MRSRVTGPRNRRAVGDVKHGCPPALPGETWGSAAPPAETLDCARSSALAGRRCKQESLLARPRCNRRRQPRLCPRPRRTRAWLLRRSVGCLALGRRPRTTAKPAERGNVALGGVDRSRRCSGKRHGALLTVPESRWRLRHAVGRRGHGANRPMLGPTHTLVSTGSVRSGSPRGRTITIAICSALRCHGFVDTTNDVRQLHDLRLL